VIPANLAAEFVAAGHAYKIPPEILAGVAQEETGMGANRGPSSAGALGLMQFEPGTAHSLGINPLNDRQAIWGAAKYLHQLGYSENPDAALRKYNAGPAGPLSAPSVVAYARNVRTYAAQFGPQLEHGHFATTTDPLTSSSSTSSSSRSSSSSLGSGLVRLLLTGTLTAAGGVLAWVGVRHTLAGAAG
jgi:hypothetical protein